MGPFDRDAVAGLPGLDAGTLVSVGDGAPSEADWRPAGELSDLSAAALERSSWSAEPPPSTQSLLDGLQIESAGLIGDDDFPGARGEDLFQDAAQKQTFGDLLHSRPSADEAELRRARDKAAEMAVQMEAMYKRIAELEAGQTDLMRRLAERELEIRRRPAEGLPPTLEAFLRAAAAAGAVAPPYVPPAPVAPTGSSTPAAVVPAPPPAPDVPHPLEPSPTEWAAPAVSGGVPGLPSLSTPQAPATSASVPPPAVPLPPTPSAPPKTLSLGKPKSFKIVPTVKSFRVVGADEAAVLPPAPIPQAAAPTPVPAMPAFTPPPPAAVVPPAAAIPAAASVPPPAPAPVASEFSLAPAASAPPLAPAPEAAPPAQFPPALESAPPSPLGPAMAPATFELGATQSLTDFSTGSSKLADLASAPTPAETAPPPMTMAFSGAGSAAFSAATPAPAMVDMSPSTEAVIARLAKPAAPPPTEPPRAPRSNKPFLIAGALLVIVMAGVGFLFLRQPKELKQMASLDDGLAPIGSPSLNEGQGAPPMAKPRSDAPQRMTQAVDTPVAAASAPESATPGVSQAALDAAIAMVKDFPLDGGRGSVAQWLQYSYTANPDAGTEQWNASVTADKTYLVEYRLVPGAPGGKAVHYLFEADMERGLVMGKNLEAREMLAGGPPPSAAPKAKPKPAVRKAAPKPAKRVRRAEPEEPKEVPLLPLPDSGELRPPAEDDGSFGTNTVDSSM